MKIKVKKVGEHVDDLKSIPVVRPIVCRTEIQPRGGIYLKQSADQIRGFRVQKMSQDKYKLVYFNARGRAEPIRFLFVALDIPFEDLRVGKTEWQELKHRTPSKKLPYLEITSASGRAICYDESMAIARMVARRHNLMGTTDEEYYRVERLIGQCADIDQLFYQIHLASSKHEAGRLTTNFISKKAPELLELIAQSLKASGGPYVLGDRPSFGDLLLLTTLDHVADIDFRLLRRPCFVTHREAVFRMFPKLPEYLSKRPTTVL
ncbi:unnamed protein product [Calicophoron daubneyi]|uniref:Glutathione S-transferase n=1 Tax=Calicophoron daubneyi TaxID=300641 RepID=A0AAV2T9M5_CALDB